jgi:hypothetical protein
LRHFGFCQEHRPSAMSDMRNVQATQSPQASPLRAALLAVAPVPWRRWGLAVPVQTCPHRRRLPGACNTGRTVRSVPAQMAPGGRLPAYPWGARFHRWCGKVVASLPPRKSRPQLHRPPVPLRQWLPSRPRSRRQPSQVGRPPPPRPHAGRIPRRRRSFGPHPGRRGWSSRPRLRTASPCFYAFSVSCCHGGGGGIPVRKRWSTPTIYWTSECTHTFSFYCSRHRQCTKEDRQGIAHLSGARRG